MGALTRPAANRKTNTPVGAAYPGTHYNLWGQPYKPVIGSILGCTRFAGYILRNIVFAAQPNSGSIITRPAASDAPHHIDHYVGRFRADNFLTLCRFKSLDYVSGFIFNACKCLRFYMNALIGKGGISTEKLQQRNLSRAHS